MCVLLIAGVMFCLNSAWALSIGEADITAQSTIEASDSGKDLSNIWVESTPGRPSSYEPDWDKLFNEDDDRFSVNLQSLTTLQFGIWHSINSQGNIIASGTILESTPFLVEAIREDYQDKQDSAVLNDNIKAQIEGIVPDEFLKDSRFGQSEEERVIEAIVFYITNGCSPLSAKMDDVALYSSVVSILGLDMPVSLEIFSENKTLEDGTALITALKEKLKITEVNFLLNEEVDSYSIAVAGEGESDVILGIADFAAVKHIKAKAILSTKHGDYQLEGKDNKFILTEPDCFDSGSEDLESEPVSILGGRQLEFSSLRYMEEYRSLVDSMENYVECPKISSPAFRLIGTVPEAELEVRLTGGEYEQELREIGAVINYVDQDEFVYRITISPNKILDLIGLEFVSYVDVHSGE
jgi:hypothetical protein